MVALAPRSLERAVRLQVEQNGGYAAAASSAEAAAAYESRIHSHFLNRHYMDYSRFGAASYGEVERSQPSMGYNNHANHGFSSQQPTTGPGSSFGCGTGSNNFNASTNSYIKRENDHGTFSLRCWY